MNSNTTQREIKESNQKTWKKEVRSKQNSPQNGVISRVFVEDARKRGREGRWNRVRAEDAAGLRKETLVQLYRVSSDFG